VKKSTFLKSIIVLTTALFLSCNLNTFQNGRTIENVNSNIFCNYDSLYNLPCLTQLKDSYLQTGNTLIHFTKKENYIKYTILNDSLVKLSCGKGAKEFFLDTLNCLNSFHPLELEYENYSFMYFFQKGGSSIWMNVVVDTQKDTIYNFKNALIDTIRSRIVEIEWNEKIQDYEFVVFHLDGGLTLRLPTNYKEVKKVNFPNGYIYDLRLSDEKLYYKIDLKADSTFYSDSLTLY
jgi:hypothetical protein